ncbi:MAG: hypothetical protein CM15mP66_12510 [Pseudomonadota bacterium]|nr:MAG: hypothetical protein CM15mP66_12510 [Pseudomonadota bacterium]
MIENTVIKEMPREISVCQYTLGKTSQPFVIEDLWEDERNQKHVKNEGGLLPDFMQGLP